MNKIPRINFTIPCLLAIGGGFVTYIFTIGSGFYKLVALYLAVTVLLPIGLTWLSNAILNTKVKTYNNSQEDAEGKEENGCIVKSIIKKILALIVGIGCFIGYYYFNNLLVGCITCFFLFGIARKFFKKCTSY